MGNEIASYEVDTIISGNEIVIGSNDDGETANYSISDIAAYAQTDGTGRMTLYDGSTDTVAYSDTFIIGTNLPLRLGFSGPLTDNTFFPSKFGTLMSNQFSSPAKSSFDFRFLTLGIFIEFDVEFDIKIETTGAAVISPNIDYSFDLKATFPNLTEEVVSMTIKSTNVALDGTLTHSVKARFATYIKEELTDSLIGGGFDLESKDFGTTDVVTITNLKIRAMI